MKLWQKRITSLSLDVVPGGGKVGVQQGDELRAAFPFFLAQGLRHDGECNLNSGQICRKVGRADGRNEFSNTL